MKAQVKVEFFLLFFCVENGGVHSDLTVSAVTKFWALSSYHMILSLSKKQPNRGYRLGPESLYSLIVSRTM